MPIPDEFDELALDLLDAPLPEDPPPELPVFPAPKKPTGAPVERMQSACCAKTLGSSSWDDFPRTTRPTRSPPAKITLRAISFFLYEKIVIEQSTLS
jgi:hypothetical protein